MNKFFSRNYINVSEQDHLNYLSKVVTVYRYSIFDTGFRNEVYSVVKF